MVSITMVLHVPGRVVDAGVRPVPLRALLRRTFLIVSTANTLTGGRAHDFGLCRIAV